MPKFTMIQAKPPSSTLRLSSLLSWRAFSDDAIRERLGPVGALVEWQCGGAVFYVVFSFPLGSLSLHWPWKTSPCGHTLLGRVKCRIRRLFPQLYVESPPLQILEELPICDHWNRDGQVPQVRDVHDPHCRLPSRKFDFLELSFLGNGTMTPVCEGVWPARALTGEQIHFSCRSLPQVFKPYTAHHECWGEIQFQKRLVSFAANKVTTKRRITHCPHD